MRRIVLRDEQNFGNLSVRTAVGVLPKHAADFQAIHFGHRDIENDHVGMKSFRFFHPFFAAPTRANPSPPWTTVGGGFEPLPDDGMIVHEQNSSCHRGYF